MVPTVYFPGHILVRIEISEIVNTLTLLCVFNKIDKDVVLENIYCVQVSVKFKTTCYIFDRCKVLKFSL